MQVFSLWSLTIVKLIRCWMNHPNGTAPFSFRKLSWKRARPECHVQTLPEAWHSGTPRRSRGNCGIIYSAEVETEPTKRDEDVAVETPGNGKSTITHLEKVKANCLDTRRVTYSEPALSTALQSKPDVEVEQAIHLPDRLTSN